MKKFFRLMTLRAVLFTLLALCNTSQDANAQVYFVPSRQQWFDTQLDMQQGEKFEMSARGTWTNGGAVPQWVGPQGWPAVKIGTALSRVLPLGALIAKIGQQVFLAGETFKGISPASGRLYLSMNDNDFPDNDGTVQVTMALHRIISTPFPGRKENIAFVSPDKYTALIQSALSDGKVQLSQTGEGVPLSVKDAKGAVVNSMSYLSFGATLNAFGVNDIDIPLPDNEWSPEQIKNTGGFTIFAQYLLTHSVLFADRFRFRVNNIHAFFGSDLSISLGNNEILLNLSLTSPDPAIRGEGNGFTGVPFGIPIPLGWKDGLCPDIAIKNLGLIIHLVPNVAADGTLHFNDPTVEVRGNLTISTFDWLSFAQQVKDKVISSFKKNVEDAIRQPKAKKGLESGLFGVFPIFTGKQNTNISSILIDKTGILLGFKN